MNKLGHSPEAHGRFLPTLLRFQSAWESMKQCTPTSGADSNKVLKSTLNMKMMEPMAL